MKPERTPKAEPVCSAKRRPTCRASAPTGSVPSHMPRSEEHTSELQSHSDLVCRLLLEKKKNEQFRLHLFRLDPSHRLAVHANHVQHLLAVLFITRERPHAFGNTRRLLGSFGAHHGRND